MEKQTEPQAKTIQDGKLIVPAKEGQTAKEIDLSPYTPLNGRVLVLQDPAKHFSREGVFIPETARVKPNTCEIIKTAEKISENLAPEDKALYRPFGGLPLKIQGEELILLHESEFFLKYAKGTPAPNE